MKTNTKSNTAKTKTTKTAQGLPVHPMQSQVADKTVTTPAPAKQPRWFAVFLHGPESIRNRSGDEVPTWHVYVGDVDAAPCSKTYVVHDYGRAARLAQAMQRDRRLELVNEADPADGHDTSTTRADTEQQATVNDYQ